MDEAFRQARALGMAQKHSASFTTTNELNLSAVVSAVSSKSDPSSSTTSQRKHHDASPTAAATKSAEFPQHDAKCFFCGLNRHPHQNILLKRALATRV